MGKILWEDFYGILSQLWFVDVGSLDKRQMHGAQSVNYCMSVLIACVCVTVRGARRGVEATGHHTGRRVVREGAGCVDGVDM